MAKKPKPKNKKPSKVWQKYKVEGDKLVRSRICPKCGPGYFMAEHKGRLVCGRCSYTLFEDKVEVKK